MQEPVQAVIEGKGEVRAEAGPMPAAEVRRRGVRVTLRLGIILLTTGAQSREAEEDLRNVMRAFGLRGGDAIVTSDSVTVSYIAPGDAETTTAIRAVREWRPDFGQLAPAGALVRAIEDGRVDVFAAERELDRIEAMVSPYPRWLRFAAPALLSAAVTIMFGGTALDSLTTFGIGLAIQPAQERVERSSLPLFFQVVFGVSMTVLLVVILAGLELPIDASLVVTGGLLRFLPGAQLVSGMRDLIVRKVVPGTANLAEVLLLGVAIAISASLVIAIGRNLLGVDLRIGAAGGFDWPPLVILAAGVVAVCAYGVRLSLPVGIVPSVAILAAIVVTIARGMTAVSAGLDGNGRTFVAAVLIGVVGGFVSRRRDLPGALWLVPSILPLLPAPATLVPMLAESEDARQALEAQAAATAFLIGVGVASGEILVTALWRRREKVRRLQPG